MTEDFLSDSELIEKVKNGDRGAFDLLYRKYSPRVLTFLVRYVGDFHKAEDLTAETFGKAFFKIKLYKEQGTFLAWLFTIAVNTAKNQWDKQDTKKTVSFKAIEREDDVVSSEDLVASREDSAGERMVKDELKSLVENAIAGLDDKYRAPLVLCEIEGLTLKEAAKALDMNVWTVATRVMRARKQLCQMLKVYKGEV